MTLFLSRPIRIPTIHECNEIRKAAQADFNNPVMKRKINSHVECVREIGMTIGKALVRHHALNLPLLDRALMLHDVSKHIAAHEVVGERLLREKGYPDVGELVRFHLIENFFFADSRFGLMPTIITYADARSGYPTSTTLEERESVLKKRYGVSEARAAGLARLKEFQQMLVESHINIDFRGIETRILVIRDLILLAGEPSYKQSIESLYPSGSIEVKTARDIKEARKTAATYGYRMVGIVSAFQNPLENSDFVSWVNHRLASVRAIVIDPNAARIQGIGAISIPKTHFERAMEPNSARDQILLLFKTYFGPGSESDGIPEIPRSNCGAPSSHTLLP